VRQYVILTGFLFSERLVYEALIRACLDSLVLYTHSLSLFESPSVFTMLSSTVFMYFTVFVISVIVAAVLLV